MPPSPRLLQLTDSHLGARSLPADPRDTLRTVVDAVRALPDPPDAVIHTGDLADDGGEEQYALLASALAALELPVHVLPGNHDDRATLRRHFDVPGHAEDPIQYAIELDGLRVLMLDTVRPGEPDGQLGPRRLSWISDALDAEPDTPTLLALHHPPVLTGMAGMDAIALARADRVGLAAVVAAHPQVCGLVAGHVHRTIASSLAGRPALTIPSTYGQLPLDLTAGRLPMVADPVGFAVHMLVGGALVSHVQTLSANAGVREAR